MVALGVLFHALGGFGAGSRGYNLEVSDYEIRCPTSAIDESCPNRKIIDGENYRIIVRKKWPGIGNSYDAVSVKKLPILAK